MSPPLHLHDAARHLGGNDVGRDGADFAATYGERERRLIATPSTASAAFPTADAPVCLAVVSSLSPAGGIRVERVPSQGVRWHPAAELFPFMDDAAAAELREDIRRNGVMEPIVFLDGAILDGRNRYMAARELGIMYPRVEYEGDDPLGFVVAKNLHRRHLTESQRGMLAARLAKMPAHRPVAGKTANMRTSQAAEMLNVSSRTIEAARMVERDGAAELVAAVDAGTVSVSAAAEVARLPRYEQTELVENGSDAVQAAAKALREGRAPPRGTPSSGNNEWHTPAEYVERARRVLGKFDIDPASNTIAQEIVRADAFFTKEDDGLTKPWHGRVWLNPPYSQPQIADFVSKLLEEYRAGRIKAAVVLTHNYTDTAWFHQLAAASTAVCFTRGRIKFVDPRGTKPASPTQGQAFTYLGPDGARFADEFRDCGLVMEPAQAFSAGARLGAAFADDGDDAGTAVAIVDAEAGYAR